MEVVVEVVVKVVVEVGVEVVWTRTRKPHFCKQLQFGTCRLHPSRKPQKKQNSIFSLPQNDTLHNLDTWGASMMEV